MPSCHPLALFVQRVRCRAGVLALGHTPCRDACAMVRADKGTCGLWSIEFTDTRSPDRTLSLTGGANLGYSRAPGGNQAFSPGIWWIGFRMNRSGAVLRILQM